LTKEEISNNTSFSKKKTILPLFALFPMHMRRTPRICVGLAILWTIAAFSTHKRGLPCLCLDHLNLGRAELSFHAYALLRHMCMALKTLGRSLPSTHMRAVLCICVALGRAS
ncbi:hypothetical protein PIB30_112194, partial [Stylosanthes scabra]|nr:hypothetical protein [Stylosanthes scabra]